MTTAIATTQPQDVLAAVLADTDRLKELEIDKVERLFALAREMQADAARREFAEAFNAVQLEMTPVRKLATNSHTRSTYALLEDVSRMLDPIVQAHGFSQSVSTDDCPTDGHIRFVLLLRHVGGHEERHYLDAPVDAIGIHGKATKTALHGMASSGTYCTRQLKCKVWDVNIVSDDDGNAAAGVGPGSELISIEQHDDVLATIHEVGADMGRFLKHFRLDSVGAMPVSRLKEAVALLEAKRGQR